MPIPIKIIGGLILALCILGACAKMPVFTDYPNERIPTGPGPEDMVLDTFTNTKNPRLLVSCSARRKNEPVHGEIWSVDLATDKAVILPRTGEPAGITYHPHGIDLIKLSDQSTRLFVINHMDSLKKQVIMEYVVKPEELVFVAMHEHKILSSPNDVCAKPGGGFYWSNDASQRKYAFIEPVLGVRGGYVGLKNETGGSAWNKSKNKFAYTNGIALWKNDLFISTVIQSRIFRFQHADISQKPEKIAKVVGGDNISFLPDGRMLVTAHLRQLNFLRHMKKSENKSQSVVYLIDPVSKSNKVVFADSGAQISTASTAIYFNGYLYICQVFDPFILKVKTGTL